MTTIYTLSKIEIFFSSKLKKNNLKQFDHRQQAKVLLMLMVNEALNNSEKLLDTNFSSSETPSRVTANS